MVPDLSTPRSVHLVAAGGAAMSGIGAILLAMGHRVTGSDAASSAALDLLRVQGAEVWVGHRPERAAAADLVGVSTAVPATDPEVVAARAAGVPVLRRAELMAALCGMRRTAAIAGAHGKTTTTALVASVLHHAGRSPSYLVGSPVAGLGGAAWDDGEWFVVEADESDGTFLELGAEAVLVTNIEPDHLDHWGDVEALAAGFRAFVAGAAGARIVCGDDPGAAAMAAAVGGCTTYGTGPGADLQILDVRTEPGGTSAFRLCGGSVDLTVSLPLIGLHNVRNAAGAAALCLALGVEPGDVAAGLEGFGGVERRFERRGSAGGVDLVDSYDHLPTEVAAVLAAARPGWERVVCVFQPHRPTRIRDLWQDFADAFVDADVVAVTDVYVPVGQASIPGVTGALVVDAVRAAHPEADVRWFPVRDELRSWLVDELRPGDLCLTLNAGDLTTLPDELLGELERRHR